MVDTASYLVLRLQKFSPASPKLQIDHHPLWHLCLECLPVCERGVEKGEVSEWGQGERERKKGREEQGGERDEEGERVNREITETRTREYLTEVREYICKKALHE